MNAIAAQVRRVVNGPKAPAGRFRSMPPRRPLVGEKVVLIISIRASPGCVGVNVGRHGPLGATKIRLKAVIQELYQLLLLKIPVSRQSPTGFLEIAGAATSEVVNSKVYSKFLDPTFNQDISNLFITALTQLIAEKCGRVLSIDVFQVLTEVVTVDGNRIDLYIDDADNCTAIIIENKIYHHLSNDLEGYYKYCSYSDEQKVGVLLTLETVEIPPAVGSSFVNIRHVEWMDRIELLGLPSGLPNRYYIYINDFIATIKYLSATMEMDDSARFYFDHADSVNKAIDTQKTAALFVDNQLRLAASKLNLLITSSNKEYKVFENKHTHPEVFYTIVFSGLFASVKRITIILELSGEKFKSRLEIRKQLSSRQAYKDLAEGRKSRKDHGHFVYKDYNVINEDVNNLSDFIVQMVTRDFEPITQEIVQLGQDAMSAPPPQS